MDEPDPLEWPTIADTATDLDDYLQARQRSLAELARAAELPTEFVETDTSAAAAFLDSSVNETG